MKIYLVVAAVLVVVVELAVLVSPDRDVVGVAAGVVAAAGLVCARWLLTRDDHAVHEAASHDPGETLQRWLVRNETLVARADTNRADWDKHLRPVLARQFELATGQRKSKDRNAFHATAEMVFGQALWRWVDPDNVSRTGGDEPGPGRAVLDELLQRLERI